jgi:hypothetical protein
MLSTSLPGGLAKPHSRESEHDHERQRYGADRDLRERNIGSLKEKEH